ncbi:MAG: TatD family hydrolase [Nitriliruptorales bacterium]
MLEFADTHCHLDYHEDLRPAEQVERARAEGVTLIVTVGTDLASSAEAVQTANRHEGVWAVVGVHPNDAMEATPAVMECVEKLAVQSRVAGIGETGLDYYRKSAPVDRQQWAFRQHIALAKRLGRTLVVHCRDAWEDTLAILEDEGAPEPTVLHCFSGDAALAQRCAAAGYFLSFAGNVTFKNAPELREAAVAPPLEALLTETDSPFLAPHPYRGRANEPAHVPLVARCLAEVRGLDVTEIALATSRNARRAFGLAGSGPR